MKELEVTWRHAAAIWWAFFWRCMVIGIIAGLVAGVAAGLMGYNAQSGWFQLATYLLMVPIAIWVIKDVLGNDFKGYRIALIAVEQPEPEAEVEKQEA